MSLQSVRAFLSGRAPHLTIIDQGASTATVAEAALGVEPGRIAKTLSVRVKDQVLLVGTRSDARLDNRKTKDALGGRPRMLGADEAEALTGPHVGGVRPFWLASPRPASSHIYLTNFVLIYPDAGSRPAPRCLTQNRA